MGRKSNFSEAQIIEAIREVEGGATLSEVARRVGVSLQTLARWRTRYSGMGFQNRQRQGGAVFEGLHQGRR
jgi:transposase-like protein